MNISGNISNQEKKYYSVISVYASAASIPVLFIGFIVNVFVLYVIVNDNFFYKTPYYLIRISLVSNIIATLIGTTSFSIAAMAHIDYTLGSYMCRIFFYIIQSSYTLSIFTLCIISIDRYFVIIKPFLRFYSKHRRNLLISMVTFALILSIIFNIPTIFYVDVYPDETVVCDMIHINSFTIASLIVNIIIIYFIPTGILLFMYGTIFKHQYNYVRPGNISIHTRINLHMKKKKFNQVLIATAASYLLITWPYFATGIAIAITKKSLRQMGDENMVYYVLAFVSYSTTVGISVINPFLYLKFDYNIKKKSRYYLQKCITRKTATEYRRRSILVSATMYNY
ncbi:Neuropeptide Y receptor type 2 [Trichoplax sp. H2]|nr:Neuropeptide Y receptor type 2 [Trichoplax sp. H2]|eukprot:RDD39725.1 Neuropeptide Y receptor type 2 [Trichoplax sp. H2]